MGNNFDPKDRNTGPANATEPGGKVRASSLLTVILHYGDPALTARVRDQLLKSDPASADDIRVLDNHAPVPFPEAWMRTETNLYWAGALARTADLARNEGFSHLWFLNNDLWFGSDPPYIARAWGRLKRLEKNLGPVGIWSPAASANPYHPQMVADSRYQYRTVEVLDGIAPLFNLECLERIGGVDFGGNIYGYGVEMMLSLQARKAGYVLVADHQVTVRHIYHSTARKVEGFMEKAALAEQRYLSARLGSEYKNLLSDLKNRFMDFERM